MGFEIISADVTQAYLQSASELKRKVFVNPNCIDLKPDELLQIMKPLYGLAESGKYYAQTFIRHHLTHLRMTQTTGDVSLFFKRARGALIGMLGCYVDDVVRTGTLEFLASATHNKKAGLSQRDHLKHLHNQVLLQPRRRTYRSRLQPSTSELAPQSLK
jgi:Reverse transcriptase (RNA-dependent DNA polymerase)